MKKIIAFITLVIAIKCGAQTPGMDNRLYFSLPQCTLSTLPVSVKGRMVQVTDSSNRIGLYDGSAWKWMAWVSDITGSSGLPDPGSNGIVKRTALNTTTVASFSDLPGITSGTYTPTFSSLTNCSSISIDQAIYTKIGNIIHVSISMSLTVTTTNTTTTFNMTLPSGTTGSTFGGTVGQISGRAAAIQNFMSGYITANSSSSTVQAVFYYTSGSGDLMNINISFDYSL